MDTSNNIISRMSTWHSSAVTQARTAELEAKKAAQEARDLANKEQYEKSLDSFTKNFETLSQLDGKTGDLDARPGNVTTRGGKSLQKTNDGFVMTVLAYQLPPGLGAVFQDRGAPTSLRTLETYTVDEKSNTISYKKMKESPMSGAGISRPERRGDYAPLGENPTVEQAYVLDLKAGTITDLTPAAPTPRERFW